jgi:hypothetical protein
MPNLPSFLGSRQAGDNSHNFALTWGFGSATGTTYDQPVSLPPFPLLSTGSNAWYEFILNPEGVQAGSEFGICRSISINIQRIRSWFVDDTHYRYAGRVALQITATNQIYVFGGKDLIVTPAPVVDVDFEVDNIVIPCWSKNNSVFNLFVERDRSSGIVPPLTTQGEITLFNFDVSASGYLG